MTTYKVNQAAVRQARRLIDEGAVDTQTGWGQAAPAAAQGSKEIEREGYDGYGRWHLGIDTEASEQTKDRYAQWVRWSILRSGRLMMIYAAMLVAVGLAFWRLPAGFLPVDDQGFITTDVLTPPDASFPRTLDAVKRVEDYLIKHPAVETLTFLTGFSFLGQGQNTAQAFITLKDWSKRGAGESPTGR